MYESINKSKQSKAKVVFLELRKVCGLRQKSPPSGDSTAPGPPSHGLHPPDSLIIIFTKLKLHNYSSSFFTLIYQSYVDNNIPFPNHFNPPYNNNNNLNCCTYLFNLLTLIR
ncbi:hypothetical protein HanRHA438_Chr10g0473441 [Helianthus annuus]|uniref:Uncharacterized protein n=1 Tax=Helianthus annuus TaxID=4232 RepID=A0A251TQH1_HELAN|nr:hypothetical protein HanXRQr2_Chr10g0460991 [Helianthus annuus]KAJ0515246.1 hypothetical protein HanHA300_Chr10g0378521 [Helianthus annuus]KAJ0531438.1 hypothetical protein HanHA89_Chr10g0401071 [Helianthus annuus]KAJ0698281.1 hypothetical protein HanLR1_Chr10g0378311 [Helianthus annuus]KAJ0701647.1 hypothetical protein HanOQP8_Chr10g0381631 [Helianthus annuus]